MSTRAQKVSQIQEILQQDPGICVCENSKYLKRAADERVLVCDDILNTTNIA